MPIALRDFNGNSVSVVTPPDNGRALAAGSRPVALSNEDFAALTALASYLDGVEGLISSTNTALATMSAFVDGLETLTGATNTALGTLHTDMIAATPVGANIIGKVGIDQTTGQNVVALPSPGSIATGQGSVTTTMASLVAARTGRKTLTIENTSAVAFYVGPTGVTATTGLLVPGVIGASVTVDSAAVFFAITASGSATASFLETF